MVSTVIIMSIKQAIPTRKMFTLDTEEWKSFISLLRSAPNLLRTSLCQESYLSVTLD